MSKELSNYQVSEYLTKIATAYEIKVKDRFRIMAYQNAAETIINYPEKLFDLWQKDPKNLDSIPHIGPSILKKIDYLFKNGKNYPSLKKVFSDIHPAVFTFEKINGIGPLIAYKLTQTLKFSRNSLKALDQLVTFCQKGKIRNIASFGEKSEESILNNTLSFLGRQKRLPYEKAKTLASKIISYLQSRFPKTNFVPLGSLRRHSDTVGDIDIAAASSDSQNIIDYFLTYPDMVEVIARGKNKASLRLLNDIHIDLMVKPIFSFGALLQHFTGSRQHNILLRRHALKLGYSLSEYGIKEIKSGNLHKFSDEEKFYQFLNLNFIPPEERVGGGELEKYKVI